MVEGTGTEHCPMALTMSEQKGSLFTSLSEIDVCLFDVVSVFHRTHKDWTAEHIRDNIPESPEFNEKAGFVLISQAHFGLLTFT